MRMQRIVRLLASVGLVQFFGVGGLRACPPLPVLLYPVEEMYAERGLEIPDLPDDAIAVIDGEYIPKADYKEWLYRKIGFEPEWKKSFLMRLRLQQILEEKGIDLEKERELILDHFFRFEVLGRLFESTEDWHKQTERLRDVTEHETYRDAALPRVKDAYLEVLYLVENWDTMHADVLEALGVAHETLTVSGDDAELQHVLRLLNGFFVMQRLEAWIQPYMARQVLAEQDLNLPDHRGAYTSWLYENHNTEFLVENYLGMILSGRYAEEHNLEISDALVQEEFALRVQEYEGLVNRFNSRLPSSATPLAISPVYLKYVMEEVRDDFYKSRAHRRVTPLQPHARMKRYYDQYGFNGNRHEVREIFKWVRMRGNAADPSRYADYVAAEEERIRDELRALRDQILADGVETFPIYALSENRDPELQQRSGLVDYIDLYGDPDSRWGAVRSYTEKLENLSLHEISPVMNGPWNSIDLFWLAETNHYERVYYMITRELPPVAGFDHVSYKENLEAARNDLKALKDLIVEGACMEELAQEHSDSYERYGADISDTYQKMYGYHFAKQVSKIPEGELGIIRNDNGLHLIQVVSRTHTPLTDEIREKIVRQYHEELASQEDRYAITAERLHSVNPYFRTSE